jgi:geranylgeranyl pyrophosphate synthase
MFGENLGIAYQLRDDIVDLSQKGKIVLKDLRSGVINLPLIHSYAVSSLSERTEIETKLQTIMNENLQKSYENVESIIQTVLQKGSFRYCEQKIDEYLRRTIDSLSALKNTKYQAYLAEMARSLKTLD